MTDLSLNPAGVAAQSKAKGRSLWDDARRRLARNPAAMASLFLLVVIVLLAIFGPFVWVHSFETLFKGSVAIGPSFTNCFPAIVNNALVAPSFVGCHPLGTDTEGGDMLARLLFGLRISLAVGLVATVVAVMIGVLWGAIAGFAGGWLDNLMMRVVDVLYSIPFVFFVILLVTVVRTQTPIANFLLIFMAIGAVEWLTMARIVRGQTIALRRKEFIEAAKASGANGWQIITRHIVPNVLGPVVVFATLNIPVIILAESFLSFLGLGIQTPWTSLGALIAEGSQNMETSSWMLVAPAITMLVLLLCLNFLGDGLRDALDPKER
jgi:oligopeptide transport system permease protein